MESISLPDDIYPLGTQFFKKTKNRKDLCTIEDHLFTYNSRNELVRFRYATSHTFLGQKVTFSDEVHTTIKLSILRNPIS